MASKGAKGHVVLYGNNEVPYNYGGNPYDYFRQDSTFRYFFGFNEPGLIGVIELDGEIDTIIGQHQTEDDIIWGGPKVPLIDEAPRVAGVTFMTALPTTYRTVHYLPAYRDDIKLMVGQPSEALIESVVELRSVKDANEIAHLDEIQAVAYEMHTMAHYLAGDGVSEQAIAAKLLEIARKNGGNLSFPSIVSRDGHIFHNPHHKNILHEGDLLLIDAGYESSLGYCTDHTRTWPIGGLFSTQQREIYQIVLAAKEAVEKNAAPGVLYKDMHLLAALTLASGLKDIGLMKGDIEEAVALGAHAMFFPHGIGHMMGMDAHDMENLGEDFVGYDKEVTRSTQFGLAWLRMARKLQPGFVVTNEPGIYFIPYLIDKWQRRKQFTAFINYNEVEKYKTFGGIRLEDNLVITETGSRLLGNRQIPL